MKKSWLIACLLVAQLNFAQENAVVDTTIVDTNMNNTEAPVQEVAVVTTNDIVTNDTQNLITNVGEISDTNTMSTNEVETNTNVSEPIQTIGYTITEMDHITASPMARFEVNGLDEQSGLKETLVSVDGSEYAIYKRPISFDTEGNHTLSYQFVDRVGNISYSKNFSIFIDATAPRVLELNVAPNIYHAAGIEYVGPNSQISFESFDDYAGVAYVEYALNDQEMVRYTTNTTFAQLGFSNTAPVRISYQAIDMVSNVSPIKSKVFVVDGTGPSVDVFAKAIDVDGTRYISSKDQISIEAFDSETQVSEILYAINDGEYQKYNDKIGIFLKESGEFTVYVKAIDVVGNESEIVEYKVVVDMIAPTGDTVYIGDVKSSEYDVLAEESKTEETTTEKTVTPVEVNENSTEENTVDPTVDSMVDPTSDELEVPAGTQVDAMKKN